MYTKKAYDEIKRVVEGLAMVSKLPLIDLGKYYKPAFPSYLELTDKDIYEAFCRSAQNGGGIGNSIKFDGDNYSIIKSVVFDFDVYKVKNKYASWNELYNNFIENGIVDNGTQKGHTNWEKYSIALWEGAKKLSNGGLSSFRKNIKKFSSSKTLTKKDLEDLTKLEVPYMKLKLITDWHKECGATDLSKPDTHIIAVYNKLEGANISTNSQNNNNLMDIMIYMFDWANDLKKYYPDMTTYKLDKIIWLSRSMNFYKDKIKVDKTLIEHFI